MPHHPTPPPRPAVEGAGWPAMPGAQAAGLLALLQQLETSQYLPPEELRARQFAQIGALVEQIDRNVPFYGLSLRRAGLRPGQPIDPEIWARVPILTRAALHATQGGLVATGLPPGHAPVREAKTSGSSGMPVRVSKTALEQFYWQAFTLREELWHRRDLSGTLLAIRHDYAPGATPGSLRHMPDWGAPVASVYPTGPALLLSHGLSAAGMVEVVRRERPDWLLTLPSILLAMLRHCRAEGIAIDCLQGVRTSAEALPPGLRALCRELWGVPIQDMYSAVETGYLAFQCPDRPDDDPAYHVQAESALVEVLHPDGRACAPGETGRVVVTPLHNFATPLIRYELGDMAELGPPCPCGRTLPVLARIPGRSPDMLRLADGGRRFPDYGTRSLAMMAPILQHQVVQTGPTTIELRLVVHRRLTGAEENEVRGTIGAALGPPFTVALVYRDAIAHGPGGKFAGFVCEVPD